MDVAWSFHRGEGLDFLQNTQYMGGRVNQLLDEYQEGFQNVCTTLSSLCTPECVFPGDANADGIANHKDLLAIGLAMGKVDMMFDILKQGWPFDTIINHNRYTLLNRNADEMFTWAHEKGIAVFNAAPYASGVLAKGSDKMPLIAYVPASEADLEPVRAIEAACSRHGIATGPAALQFSMQDPRIASTVVGVTKPERVAETLAWAEARISDEALEELNALPCATDDPEENRDYKPG
jgi:D-threo-aldose 1-dehydrogenase